MSRDRKAVDWTLHREREQSVRRILDAVRSSLDESSYTFVAEELDAGELGVALEGLIEFGALAMIQWDGPAKRQLTEIGSAPSSSTAAANGAAARHPVDPKVVIIVGDPTRLPPEPHRLKMSRWNESARRPRLTRPSRDWLPAAPSEMLTDRGGALCDRRATPVLPMPLTAMATASDDWRSGEKRPAS